MYKAIICCRAGMGSSMLLKIKADQVIKENDFPISTKHATIESINEYDCDLIITMDDFSDSLSNGLYVCSVHNIMDKEELKNKLQQFLDSKN